MGTGIRKRVGAETAEYTYVICAKQNYHQNYGYWNIPSQIVG